MIKLKTNDISINILKNNSQSTDERNFELLIDYVSVLKEIYDDTKVHEISWSYSSRMVSKIK